MDGGERYNFVIFHHWEQNSWTTWRVQSLLDKPKNQLEELKLLLVGASPINKESQDNYIWDPNGGKFTVKLGYNFLQNYNNYENWNLWIATWKNECLPKIFFFGMEFTKRQDSYGGKFKEKRFPRPLHMCHVPKRRRKYSTLILELHYCKTMLEANYHSSRNEH